MLFTEVTTRFGGYIFNNHKHDAYHDQNHDKEEGTNRKHGHRHTDNGNSRLQQLWNRLFNGLTEGIDVVGIDRHDIPMLVSVKIANRKLLHTSKELITKGT